LNLTNQRKRALLASAHQIRAKVTINSNAVNDPAIEHVRAALQSEPLLKLRVLADHKPEAVAAAEQIAAAVGAEWLSFVGRVALLWKPATESPSASTE